MSTVFMPGDVRTTSIARESHARPATEASAAHVNGTQVISQNAPKPVTKAHKAYKTEKERKKGDKSKARDLLNKPAVVGLSGQRDISHVSQRGASSGHRQLTSCDRWQQMVRCRSLGEPASQRTIFCQEVVGCDS